MRRWIAIALLSLAVIACMFRGGQKKPAPDAKPRTDQMIQALKDDGWTVVTAEEYGNMQWAIADLETDTSTLHGKVRELIQTAKVAGGEVRAVAEFSAQAESALRLSAEAHGDTLLTLEHDPTYAEMHRQPDSLVADFDDGVFSGRVAYFPAPEEFSLLVRAQIDAALGITSAADGRTIFSVIPNDPRVRINLDRALYSSPPPVNVCSFGQRAKAGAIGSVLGTVVGLALR